MKFGLIGERLPHSFSPQIHKEIAGYDYELREVARGDLDAFMTSRDFTGINVTIPYKERVIPYLYSISEEASRIGAVNTVVNRGGKLYGFNTDIDGMRAMLLRAGIGLCGRKVLILGTGGTSKTARVLAEKEGAREILLVSRSEGEGRVSYEEAYHLHADAEVILNATPVGMFPNADAQPIGLLPFARLSGVADVIYNPLRTRLVLAAKDMGIRACGGLYMLVSQAAKAAEIFTGRHIPQYIADRAYSRIYEEKCSIVLVGMPSCGKTTVGRMLARDLQKEFVDVDEEIEKESGQSPATIIKERGEAVFRKIEKETVQKLSQTGGRVIACGGGAVKDPDNRTALRQNGRVFFLDRAPEKLLCTPDRPLSDTPEKLKKLYAERRPLYLAAADVVIDANGSVGENAAKIKEEWSKI